MTDLRAQIEKAIDEDSCAPECVAAHRDAVEAAVRDYEASLREVIHAELDRILRIAAQGDLEGARIAARAALGEPKGEK